MMKNTIFITLILVCLASCSTKKIKVDHHISTTAGLSPETSGRLFSGSVELTIQTDHKLYLIESTQTSLFGSVSEVEVSTNKSLEESLGVGIKGSLGLWKYLDFLIKRKTEAPIMYGFKLQLFGKPLKELEEGLKIAIAAYYGEGTDTEEGSYSFTLEDGGHDDFDNVSGDVEIRQRELAFMTGYRLKRFFLLYGSAFYTHAQSKARIVVNNKPAYTRARTEYITGALGARLNTTGSKLNLFCSIEIGRSRGKIRGQSKQTIDAFEFTTGLTW